MYIWQVICLNVATTSNDYILLWSINPHTFYLSCRQPKEMMMKNRIRPHILVLVSIDFYCDSLLFSPVVTIGEPAVVCALKTIRMAAIFREPIQDLVQEQESSCKTVPGADHSSNQSLTCSHPESSQGTRNFGQFSILRLHIPVC